MSEEARRREEAYYAGTLKDDYISRKAVLDKLNEECGSCADTEYIFSLPGIEKRKKGKWMGENTRSASYIFKCSCCGKNAYFVHGKGRGRNCENRYCGYDYCPNCGADMRGDNDEAD